MSIQNVSAFKDCYIMQSDDIKSFADTLADGFNQYSMFQYACNGKYDHDKMRLFWAMTIAVIADNAICIADSPEFNSVLAYVRPKSKEASFIDYVKAGGLKMFLKLGWRSTIKLMRFDAEMQKVAKQLGDSFGCAVLVKGGHSINDANDVLYENGSWHWFKGERIHNPNTHGTGCTLSSAIASNLAKGYSLEKAVECAKAYISGALKSMLDLGKGSGPLDHGFAQNIC